MRGRTMVALGLAGFLAVTTSVTWRRARGSQVATRLHALRAEYDALQAERTQLEGAVRRAGGRVELVPRVERLGMRVPSDSQVIDLPLPEKR